MENTQKFNKLRKEMIEWFSGLDHEQLEKEKVVVILELKSNLRTTMFLLMNSHIIESLHTSKVGINKEEYEYREIFANMKRLVYKLGRD